MGMKEENLTHFFGLQIKLGAQLGAHFRLLKIIPSIFNILQAYFESCRGPAIEVRMPLKRTLLQLCGALIAAATVLAASTYAVFMVVWLHAPAVTVLTITLLLSVPCLAIAWGAFALANRTAPNA